MKPPPLQTIFESALRNLNCMYFKLGGNCIFLLLDFYFTFSDYACSEVVTAMFYK